MSEFFRRFSHQVSLRAGKPWSIVLAFGMILVWLLTGPYFHFSDTWQLVINTTTSVVTFLMVFVIQGSQNRDAEVFHLRLNELIKGVQGARSELVDLEEMSDEELRELHAEYKALHDKLAHHLEKRLRG